MSRCMLIACLPYSICTHDTLMNNAWTLGQGY